MLLSHSRHLDLGITNTGLDIALALGSILPILRDHAKAVIVIPFQIMTMHILHVCLHVRSFTLLHVLLHVLLHALCCMHCHLRIVGFYTVRKKIDK